RKLDWTQEELSEKVDISPKFMSRIEGSKDRPSLEMIIKFANVLDVPLISLFVDDKDKNKDDVTGQIKYMISEFTKEQQKYVVNIIINTITEIKKILK
ncbi:MAG: helix-turn-helix transcriptional regulator, partial [Elusimicrobia bacterium]|nr:helix-turn-helix transcriptional regulator [Elusimicrobiota bacterium]